MATEKNLQSLLTKGYDYVVNGKRQKRVEFAADFLDKSEFIRVEGRPENKSTRPVFVRRLKHGAETVVLCRSDGRRDKEDAIQDGAERKLIEGLEKLQARILRDDPKLKLAEGSVLVNRVIGRLISRTTRASKLYDIDYEHDARELTWSRRKTDWDKNRQLHGCYHLRSSIDMSDQQLWKLYITLTRVEDAFRHMKSDRVSPDSDEVGTSVVSRRARPLVIFSVPPIFKHHPDTISKSRHRAQHDGAQRQSSNPVAQGHSKQTQFRLSYSQRGNPNQCLSYPTTLHPPTAAGGQRH
jgi:hypothetical protein